MVVKNKHLPALPFTPKQISRTILDTSWQGKNIENMIGATQVPLGVAGPIKLPQMGEFVVPLATTEAALVASTNRGLKALRQSGSLQLKIHYAGMTRGPIFQAPDLDSAQAAGEQIKDQLFNQLQQLACQVSSHLKLIKIQTQVLGRYLFIRFRFDTDEAMGMNMVTYATRAIGRLIQERFNLKLISLSGNFCADKKFSFANQLFGRGYQVWLEANLPGAVVKQVLKTSAAKLDQAYKAKIIYGTAISGSLSFNAHLANVLAAFYLATGQDLAHVAENAHGFFLLEAQGDDVYTSLFLPNLNLGAVGGGTNLPTQKEAIELIMAGVKSGYKGRRSAVLAGLVGAAGLGAELSLLAALAEDQLACAHQVLSGRRES